MLSRRICVKGKAGSYDIREGSRLSADMQKNVQYKVTSSPRLDLSFSSKEYSASHKNLH